MSKLRNGKYVQKFIEIIKILQGININTSYINGKDTILSLVNRTNPDINIEQLKEIGLDPNYQIGQIMARIIRANKGKGTSIPPTPEELEELINLGINIHTQRRDIVQELIRTLKILDKMKVNISGIKDEDTILTIAQQSNISIEQLIKQGLNPKKTIGKTIKKVRDLYIDNLEGKSPTEEQAKELRRLGVRLKRKEKYPIQTYIGMLYKLKKLEVDVSQIKGKDTVLTLVQRLKPQISIEQLEEEGVDPDFKIGQRKRTIIQAYRGNGTGTRPTGKQVEELQNLGIKLEDQNKNLVKIFIQVLKKLKKLEVVVSKIKATDTVLTLVQRIKPQISKEQLEKEGIDPDYKVGKQLNKIRKKYNQNIGRILLTDTQVDEIKGLGIELDIDIQKKEENDIVQEFLNILENLKAIGVDISKIVFSDTVLTLAKKSGIDQTKLEEQGLNPKYKIGNRMKSILQALEGKNQEIIISDEQRDKLQYYRTIFNYQKTISMKKFVGMMSKLKGMGVNLSRIKDRDTILSLVNRTNPDINLEQLKEHGLDPNYRIGNKIMRIRYLYGEENQEKIKKGTKVLLDKLESLGIRLKKRDKFDIMIAILETLHAINVDTSKVAQSDTILTLALKSGVGEEQLRAQNLDLDYKIGENLRTIRNSPNGKNSYTPPTEEQMRRLLELGVDFKGSRR